MSSGHFPSEDGRFALRRVNQGEMGDGLQVWPNTSIPKNTKLLAFEVIEVFDNKVEFENYRAAAVGHYRVIKTRVHRHRRGRAREIGGVV